MPEDIVVPLAFFATVIVGKPGGVVRSEVTLVVEPTAVGDGVAGPAQPVATIEATRTTATSRITVAGS